MFVDSNSFNNNSNHAISYGFDNNKKSGLNKSKFQRRNGDWKEIKGQRNANK